MEFLAFVGFMALIILIPIWIEDRRKSPRSSKCGDGYCDSRSDPRCVAGNCTYHCQSITGCHARCLDAWAKSGTANEIAKSILDKARAK